MRLLLHEEGSDVFIPLQRWVLGDLPAQALQLTTLTDFRQLSRKEIAQLVFFCGSPHKGQPRMFRLAAWFLQSEGKHAIKLLAGSAMIL